MVILFKTNRFNNFAEKQVDIRAEITYYDGKQLNCFLADEANS